MKRLNCHCGAIEAEIKITDKLEKFLGAIAPFAKEKVQ